MRRTSRAKWRGDDGIVYTFGMRGGHLEMRVRAGFEYVERWLATRAELGVGDADPVFCLVDGKPMTSSYVLLPRLGRRAGILRRIHAHGFRHTRAAEIREESVDIGVISKQLGHLSIATTARYLDHIAPWDVVEAMGRRTW